MDKLYLDYNFYKSTIEKNDNFSKDNNKELKELADQFTSILIQQMFKTMRKTIPDNNLLDGGYAEDVFTDMLDEEISKVGVSQQNFSSLSELLYQELLLQNKD